MTVARRASLRRSPIRKKRPTARTHKCPICFARTELRTCPNCGVKRDSKRASVVRHCEMLAAYLVKRLARFACQRCGIPGTPDARGRYVIGLDWAHIKVRRHGSSKYVLENAMALCRNCHDYFGTRESEWMRFVNETFGGGHYERMEQLANTPWDRDLAKVLAYLKEQMARLGGKSEKGAA